MKRLYLIFAFFMPMLPPWQSPINATTRSDAFVFVGAAVTTFALYNLTSKRLDDGEAATNICFLPAGILLMLNAENIVGGFDRTFRR